MKNISQISVISNPPKRLGWIVHAIVWVVLLLVPLLFRGIYPVKVDWIVYLRFFVILTGIFAVFYANYSCLVKRFVFTRRHFMYLLSNLLLFAIIIVVTHLFLSIIPSSELILSKKEIDVNVNFQMIMSNCFKYIFIVILSVAIKVTSSWYQMDAERKELEKQRSDAELQNLKNQLNPHFLFNTLNNIYSLIAINGEQAQETIHELSRLLRYILYDSANEFVPLGKDIDFVCNYVKLMQIRMPEHVDLKTEIQVEKKDTLIAPLLFISLAENAFKHGISASKPSFVHIEIIATQEQIKCLIRNSFFPKDKHDKSGSGIGLVNLRKRLDLLYPENYELTCGHLDETYSCELIINISDKP